MIYLGLNDLTKSFSLVKNPVVVTNIDEENEEALSRQLFANYESDRFDPVPSCYCGEERGFWLEGENCIACGYDVAAIWSESQNSSASVWFSVTPHVPKIMNLKVLINIKEFFNSGVGRFCPISFFVSADYRPSKETALVKTLRDAPFARGYNEWCENYIAIFEWLLTIPHYKSRAKAYTEANNLRTFLQKTKAITFSTHHPLPRRGMIVVEKTAIDIYKDPVGIKALDAIRMLQGLKFETPLKQKKRIAKASLMLATFHTQFMAKCVLRTKHGLARKAIFGTRTHHSSRNVIVSKTEPHDMNVFEIPWGSVIAMMQPHLINKLHRRGHAVIVAKRILNSAVKVFDQEVSGCIDELLAETKRGVFSITVNRNPTMGPESLHLTNATAGRDPADESIKASALLVKFFNSDFDGDFKNLMLMLDLKMERLMAPMQSHFNLFALEEPGVVTSCLHLPDPLVATTSNWLSNRTARTTITKEREAYMEALE